MPVHRLKSTFTSGETDPYLKGRKDFERYNNGCKTLVNMVVKPQGPVERRPGTEFVADLTDYGVQEPVFGLTPWEVRLVPFIFNELQSYQMVFFRHTDGSARVIFARPSLVVSNLSEIISYSFPVPTECPPGTPLVGVSPGDTVEVILPNDFDILNFDYAQSGDEIYIVQSGKPLSILTRFSDECWTYIEPAITDAPSEWSSINGYPEAISFHQQRLVLANHTLARQKTWLSKAGDFLDFGVSGTVIDSDAVTYTLDSGTQNQILWLVSGKALFTGTIGNEWTTTGATRNALTPSNILAQRQSNDGSQKIKPLYISSVPLFVEQYGKSIKEFVYNFQDDAYKTSDLSVLSEHITRKASIISWAYQKLPNHNIWCVLEDGTAAGITYKREHDVVGWHRHNTKGEFIDVSSNPGTNREDDVWFLVQRVIDGNQKLYLERFPQEFTGGETGQDPSFAKFLDCRMETLVAKDGTDTVTGLDHLEGEVVSVLTNGVPHPDRTVVGGSITLDDVYSIITVGLPYVSEIEPNLPDIPTGNGTIHGRTQKIQKVDIEVFKSSAPMIGVREMDPDGFPYDRKVQQMVFRSVEHPINSGPLLFTGIHRETLNIVANKEQSYFIRQSDPLPLTIIAITDHIEVTEDVE